MRYFDASHVMSALDLLANKKLKNDEELKDVVWHVAGW